MENSENSQENQVTHGEAVGLVKGCGLSGFWLSSLRKVDGRVWLYFPAEWDRGAFIRATRDVPMSIVRDHVVFLQEHLEAVSELLHESAPQGPQFRYDAFEHIARRDRTGGSALPPIVWAQWEERWLEIRAESLLSEAETRDRAALNTTFVAPEGPGAVG